MTHAAVHVLGILSAVVVAFALFLTLCAIAGCMLSSRISARERREAAAMLAERRAAPTSEPDPIETYPPLAAVPVTPLAPIIVVGVANAKAKR